MGKYMGGNTAMSKSGQSLGQSVCTQNSDR